MVAGKTKRPKAGFPAAATVRSGYFARFFPGKIPRMYAESANR